MACHLNVPLAVALIGGRALAPIPGLATVEPDPQLALVLFLSLLIQASAHQTDHRGSQKYKSGTERK
jgi:monovalent cation/hydrogen antiporter